MKFTEERLKNEYRSIYELLDRAPRIQVKEVAHVLGINRNTAGARLKDAVDKGYIVGPQIRKKSFLNLAEYIYFIHTDDPIGLFRTYTQDPNVVYHTLMDGFSNLRIISLKELDLDGVVAGGRRSDYHISYAPDNSWEHSIKTMQEMMDTCDPEPYVPRGFINTHWSESAEWSETDEILFRELKYDLRKPATPLMKTHHISADNISKWLERLPECCTIFTSYFPETVAAYDPYVFMVETDYEDFVIELFSHLPTTTWFYRVSKYLFLDVWLDRGSMKSDDYAMQDINRLHIPLLVRELLKRGIIKSEAHALVQCYWRKDLANTGLQGIP
ncbi:MAG: winged helix-turn-helix domain-containing protein [Theionarchaea archaeon]|nr:winged helix-turn-helix domain-containing protein [Theionarchaea archaeon]